MKFLNTIILLVLVQNCCCQFWTAKNNKLYDPNGNEFLIRGINSANADWDSFSRYYARNSFANIAKTGANLVRIQWRIDTKMNMDDFKNLIEEAKKQKLVAMIELHDATGSQDESALMKCAQWWKDQMWLLNNYKRNVIINIANEWSPWGTAYDKWFNAYKNAVNKIRESGWEGALVVDASAYAQNSDSIIQYGQQLLNSDPKKNLVFSLHMYAEWKNPGGRKIGDALYNIQQKGLTVIVGEFTLHHPDNCDWIKVDIWELMRQCKWKNVGYIAWSWHGNGVGSCNLNLSLPDKSLNMVKGDANQGWTWNTNDYTEFGNAVVYFQEFGILATSKKASIF